ncbi:hypothetical protein E2P81_ATG01081 [Venturia nashicola]|nr:hypothetical protein E2P81_ATG01081 [Venturia nashicola]
MRKETSTASETKPNSSAFPNQSRIANEPREAQQQPPLHRNDALPILFTEGTCSPLFDPRLFHYLRRIGVRPSGKPIEHDEHHTTVSIVRETGRKWQKGGEWIFGRLEIQILTHESATHLKGSKTHQNRRDLREQHFQDPGKNAQLTLNCPQTTVVTQNGKSATGIGIKCSAINPSYIFIQAPEKVPNISSYFRVSTTMTHPAQSQMTT